VIPVAPGTGGPRNWSGSAAITAVVLRELIDALADGVALTDDTGILALADRRLEEMFGYEHAELIVPARRKYLRSCASASAVWNSPGMTPGS